MADPLFSVVIPTHGRAELLNEAIQSVLRQTVSDFECVVVDDGSPQAPSVPDDPRIRVVRREATGGPAAARNTGLGAARGRYVTFLDDDDLWLPHRLELARKGLTEAEIAICHRASLGGSTRSSEELHGDVHDVICDSFSPSLGQVAIERRVCPLFDERFLGCEDVDWWLRATRTLRVTTVPEVGYLVRSHTQPRVLHGVSARLAGSRLLLDVHRDYYAVRSRARAFREFRIGLLELALRDQSAARRSLLRSLRIRPSFRTAWYLTRSFASLSRRTSSTDL